MNERIVCTRSMAEFANSVFEMNYHEVVDLYQVSVGNVESQTTFHLEKAGSGEDTLIIYPPSSTALRLSPSAQQYFPIWIEKNLMNGLDVESYYGLQYALEKDKIEKERSKQ